MATEKKILIASVLLFLISVIFTVFQGTRLKTGCLIRQAFAQAGCPACFCNPCTCGAWANNNCGAGGCAANQMNQTRTCNPAGCDVESQCVNDAGWTGWANDACGVGGCAATEMRQTRTSTPYGCTTQAQCVSDSGWTGWTDDGCGLAPCAANQMRQTRTSTPYGCTTQTQCVAACACASCGDGLLDVACGEQCDPGPPLQLGGETCVTQGFDGGTLSCTATCTFTTAGCFNCNDGNCEVAKGECESGCAADDCDLSDCCGNGTCNPGLGETFSTCSRDCTTFTCGDGICSAIECSSCPGDCTVTYCCGNGVCDAGVGERFSTCPRDCEATTIRRGVLPNPLQAENIPELIGSIGDLIFYIGLALVTLMILIGGVMFTTAAGDPTRVATAKRLLFWTAVGAGIVLFAKAVTGIIAYILGG